MQRTRPHISHMSQMRKDNAYLDGYLTALENEFTIIEKRLNLAVDALSSARFLNECKSITCTSCLMNISQLEQASLKLQQEELEVDPK